jgi:hypothetical protein
MAAAAAAAAVTADVKYDSSAPKLQIYFPRKPVPDGRKRHHWIGLRPAVLPTKAANDEAVAAMRGKYEISVVNRPDDGLTDPSEIEDFHVTFVAMVKPDADMEELVAFIKELRLTADDLTPKIDEKTGKHAYRLLTKGSTAFVIFEYNESSHLHEARRVACSKYCKSGEYTPLPAHVTAAYGVLRPV